MKGLGYVMKVHKYSMFRPDNAETDWEGRVKFGTFQFPTVL